ncbi:nephrin-like [Lytechinus pictus]|uniref:nephrin-like n=1 Tax=Lytechinus pictus TaxID=7653 RepID=UPI0030B9EEB4
MAPRFGSLCYIVVLIELCLVHHSLQQINPIVMGPVDTEAAEGTDAVFYCKVRTGQGLIVYWIVDRSIAVGPNVNRNKALPKYEIFGNPSNGYYNLRIKNVTLDDAFQYDCLVDAQGGGSNFEAGATLSVVNPAEAPAGPSCLDTTANEIVLDEGDELGNYRCRSSGGRPLGELKWSLLRSDQTLVDVNFDTQVDSSPSITATSSSYTMTAADHESQLACSLTHPSLNSDATCTVPSGSTKLIVRHFPIIDFGPRLDVHYLETKNVTIRCTATAYPGLISNVPELTFSDRSMLLETTLVEEGAIEAVIRISQRSDVGKSINCSATNAMGTTTTTLEIELTPVLPVWLLVVLMIIACLIVLLLSLCCCYCFCNGCKPKPADDQPDLGDFKAAGYDVSESRSASVFQPNGLNGTDLRPINNDGDSFDDMPLNDYTEYPPPPPVSDTTTGFNDHETGEVNDGYLSPDAEDRFPPMIEDEHLMGEKRISSFKPDDMNLAPSPLPSLDLAPPKPIPIVEDE